MYECKECGGQLRFIIRDQLLHCEHCSGTFPPDEYDRDFFAGRDSLDVTVYRCPNCGGEIAATNLSAVETCSYCGRTMIPEELKTSIAMPKEIIPFRIDKAQCIELYRRHVSRYRNVPARMKDAAFLENFRPVYVPYWSYDVDFKKDPVIPTSVSRQKGGYRITEHYQIEGDLDASTSGILYDASSQLHDRIGQFVMPFHSQSKKPFHPAYLFGFFADRSDTSPALYVNDALDEASGFMYRNLERALPNEKIKEKFNRTPAAISAGLGAKLKEAACLMVPMWFLTWREGDQVCYAVVNGETGKVFSDLPLSRGRFLAFSAVTAAALFAAALLFLPTLSIYTSLLIACGFGVSSLLLYALGSAEIDREILHLGDRAYRTAKGLPETPSGIRPIKKSRKKRKKEATPASRILSFFKKLLTPIVFLLGYALIGLGFTLGADLFFKLFSHGIFLGVMRDRRTIFYLLFAFVTAYLIHHIRRRRLVPYDTLEDDSGVPVPDVRERLRDVSGSICGITLAILVHLINPARNLWYYGVMMICIIGVAASILALLKQYNLLATHPEPHFFTGEDPS